MKKCSIWVSFDLGIKGDYNGFYAWLDNKKAKECGDNFAKFDFEYTENVVTELKQDISDCITISKTDRIYVIINDTNNAITTAGFIFGGRKNAPWTGYGFEQETFDILPVE